METRNGKKPLAAKAQAKPTPLNMDDIFGNTLGLDPAIREALKKKGLSYRFVSAAKLQMNAGYHIRAWRPIKLKDIEGYGTIDLFGSDPDGYVRRGDLVLAVRPIELNEKHKTLLAQEANRAKGIQKRQADELRQHFKETGLDKAGMSVIEGYEEDEK